MLNDIDARSGATRFKDIYFAGGCFWGVEEYFSRIPGVYDASAGYANGNTENPTYEDVCAQNTDHAEAVHVRYDPETISLRTLAELFFDIIDPLSVNRQGNDAGRQYRTGIYFTMPEDRLVLEGVMEKVRARYGKPLAVELRPLANYYQAEEYHQDYLKKNPGGYCHIKFDGLKNIAERVAGEAKSGRYAKPSDEELKVRLSPEEYMVTQLNGTEPPFSGRYWDNKRRGIYVDAVTGEPLFSSSDKYDSGSGWPSFTRPIHSGALIENEDNSHGLRRVEVKSRAGHSHLGHVFEDGPKDKGGLRYCINSAAMRFVPYDNMEEEGLGEYKKLVK